MRLFRTWLKWPRDVRRFAPRIDTAEVLAHRPDLADAAHWSEIVLLEDMVFALHRDGTVTRLNTGSSGQAGVLSRVTFERRFSPGAQQVDSGRLQPGDTLLGRQVMFLTFDAEGAVASCKVVATSGDAAPTYDCDEAKKELFRAQASAEPSTRQAFLTILAYGHTEEIA